MIQLVIAILETMGNCTPHYNSMVVQMASDKNRKNAKILAVISGVTARVFCIMDPSPSHQETACGLTRASAKGRASNRERLAADRVFSPQSI